MRRLLPLLLVLAACDGLSLPEAPAAGDYFSIRWSAARGEAVVVGYDGVGAFDPGSGAFRRVSSAFELGGEVSVAVSPDGRYVYTSAPDAGADPNAAPWNVYRVDLDTGERAVVVGDVRGFVLSPDGQTLYVRRPMWGPTDSTYAVPVGGGRATVVADGWPAAVSPDGTELLLARRFDTVVRHDVRTGAQTDTGLSEQDVIEPHGVQWTRDGLFVLRAESFLEGESERARFVVEDVLRRTRTLLWEGEGSPSYRYPRWGWRPGVPDAVVQTYTCRAGWGYDCLTREETVRYVSTDRDRDLGTRLGTLTAGAISDDGTWFVYLDAVAGGSRPVAVRLRDLGAR